MRDMRDWRDGQKWGQSVYNTFDTKGMAARLSEPWSNVSEDDAFEIAVEFSRRLGGLPVVYSCGGVEHVVRAKMGDRSDATEGATHPGSPAKGEGE